MTRGYTSSRTDPFQRFCKVILNRLGNPPAGYRYNFDPGHPRELSLELTREDHPGFLDCIPLAEHGYVKDSLDAALVDTVSLHGAVSALAFWVERRDIDVSTWVKANTGPRWHHTLAWGMDGALDVASWQLMRASDPHVRMVLDLHIPRASAPSMRVALRQGFVSDGAKHLEPEVEIVLATTRFEVFETARKYADWSGIEAKLNETVKQWRDSEKLMRYAFDLFGAR